MKQDTWDALDAMFAEFPHMRAEGVSLEELDAASNELGVKLDPDYKEFLARYGGAMAGPYPILGLRAAKSMARDTWSVIAVTKEYWSQQWPGVREWYVISVDHAGNPVGIALDGTVWMSDHDFGEMTQIASSFEDYLRRRCLKLEL